MFADPITLSINGAAKTLARIAVGNQSASYMSADGVFTLEVSHQVTKASRIRTTLRFTHVKAVTDPISGETRQDSTTETRTFDRPVTGFSDTDWYYDTSGVSAWMSQANVTKLFGRES